MPMWTDSWPRRPVSGWRRGSPRTPRRSARWTTTPRCGMDCGRCMVRLRTNPYRRGCCGNRDCRQWQRPVMAMAASLVLLVAGGFIGVQLERGHLVAPLAGTPSVVREAAMAYAVYSPEVRHPVEVPGDQEQHLVTWLTKRMGVEVRAPQLDPLGFGLVGGRLLASDDGPGALLMYEDAQGRRVVLYACRDQDSARDTAFRFGQEEDVSVFYWREGPLSYALAGELDRPAPPGPGRGDLPADRDLSPKASGCG